MLTSPFVLALRLLVAIVPAVMLPAPETKLIVPPVKAPAVCVMVPVPVAVTVIVFVAVAPAPNAMLPLTAVDCIVKFVVEETRPLLLRLPAAERVRAPAVAVNPVELRSVELAIVPEPIVPETSTAKPEFVTVAMPVLLRTIVLACVFTLPIAPLPSLRLTVAPMTFPAD